MRMMNGMRLNEHVDRYVDHHWDPVVVVVAVVAAVVKNSSIH